MSTAFTTRRPAQSERQADSDRRIRHRRNRGHGGRGRFRIVARRHADQDRGRQDRDHRRHAHGDRLRQIEHPVQAIADGGRCTWFLTPAIPSPREKLDRRFAGAQGHADHRRRCCRGPSRRQEPAARRRDPDRRPVCPRRCRDGTWPDAHEIGRGLIAYDAADADKIKGRSSPDVMAILGISGRAEMIHRDDLVVGGSRTTDPA